MRSDSPKARGCSGGRWLHLEQVMANHTGDWARVGSRGTAQHHTQPRNPQPGDCSRAKPGSPGVRSRSGWRRQETRCRHSCSAAAAWNQLQHFYWFHPFHHLPFLLRTASPSFPAMPCPCLRAGVCQGCRGQGSTKDHRSNQTDLRELFKGLQELQTGCCNGFTTLFNSSEVSEKCMYSPAIQEPLIKMSLKWIIRACTVSPKHWPCLWCVRLGDSDGAFWCC